jgi:uncharacterized membrane protein YeiB
LLRDYTTLSLLFLMFFGIIGAHFIPDRDVAFLYAVLLISQFVLVVFSARNAGVRMVTNVLALKTA